MYFLGFAFLVFGLLIILNPALLAYIVAFFFIFLGVQMIFIANRMRSLHNKSQSGFSFGGYEIIKRKK